jgi:hypothetical protein
MVRFINDTFYIISGLFVIDEERVLREDLRNYRASASFHHTMLY